MATIIAGMTRVQRLNAVWLEVCEYFTMDRHSFSKLVVQRALGFGISQLDAIFALPGGRLFHQLPLHAPILGALGGEEEHTTTESFFSVGITRKGCG